MKKGLSFALVILLSLGILAGCGGRKPEGMSDEEYFATSYYKEYVIPGKFDAIYDKVFAPVSRKCIPKDDYVTAQKTERFESGITPVSYVATKSERIEVDNFLIFKIDGLLKVTKNGAEEETTPTLDYFIKLNGGYLFLYEGIYKQKKYVMSETDVSNNVHCSVATFTNTVDGIELELLMKNDNPRSYSFGGKGDCTVSITVNEKSFTTKLDAPVIIEKKSTATVKAAFPGAVGVAGGFSVSGIYTLDSKGEISAGDGGQSYSVKVNSIDIAAK